MCRLQQASAASERNLSRDHPSCTGSSCRPIQPSCWWDERGGIRGHHAPYGADRQLKHQALPPERHGAPAWKLGAANVPIPPIFSTLYRDSDRYSGNLDENARRNRSGQDLALAPRGWPMTEFEVPTPKSPAKTCPVCGHSYAGPTCSHCGRTGAGNSIVRNTRRRAGTASPLQRRVRPLRSG
jgi:hypothetical protein